ncbi:MAG: hypothetical protein QXP52_02635, partial [Candidatus Aenigmatarchaeota archaeon]
MKLVKTIEFEIEGDEKICNFAEIENSGKSNYVFDIPIISKNFNIDFYNSKILLIGNKSNASVDIKKEYIDYLKKEINNAKISKFIIFPPRTIYGDWRMYAVLTKDVETAINDLKNFNKFSIIGIYISKNAEPSYSLWILKNGIKQIESNYFEEIPLIHNWISRNPENLNDSSVLSFKAKSIYEINKISFGVNEIVQKCIKQYNCDFSIISLLSIKNEPINILLNLLIEEIENILLWNNQNRFKINLIETKNMNEFLDFCYKCGNKMILEDNKKYCKKCNEYIDENFNASNNMVKKT